jgi:hypothetical protein
MQHLLRSAIHLTEVGESHLIDVYARIKSGEIPRDMAPQGFVDAIDKLPDDVSTELILSTIVGEVIGRIMLDELPKFCPTTQHGIDVHLSTVTYLEAPGVLAAPSDVTPLVVIPTKRTLH